MAGALPIAVGRDPIASGVWNTGIHWKTAMLSRAASVERTLRLFLTPRIEYYPSWIGLNPVRGFKTSKLAVGINRNDVASRPLAGGRRCMYRPRG